MSPSATTNDRAETHRWVERLSGDDDVRDAAIEELRSLLVRGLAKSMSQRYNAVLSPEDVVQEALVKILRSLDQFAGRSQFTTWAMTIAVRTAISCMRRKHFEDVSIESFRDHDQRRFELAISHDPPVEQNLDRGWVVEQLQTAIDRDLTERQRLAIRLSLEGMPVEIIAEKIGGTRNTIYKVIHDAKLKLRQSLERAGVTVDLLQESID